MEMVSRGGQQKTAVVMVENEGEEGLTEVYKPPGVRRRSLSVLTPQEPVNLGQDGGGPRK